MRRYLACAALCAVFIMNGCAAHYSRVQDHSVHLYLRSVDAESVSFVSSLDGFVPHPAVRNAEGLWEITVSGDREFRYFYLVNGTPFAPPCRFRERDDFGSENCLYIPGM